MTNGVNMKKTVHVFASLLAVLCLTAGIQLVTQGAAVAASCINNGCTGQDPTATGCSNDGRTVDSFLGHFNSNIGKDVYVELRSSPACNARWLRVTPTRSNLGCGGGAPTHVRLRNLASNGTILAERLKTFDSCGGQFVTAMVGHTNASARTQFCFTETPNRDAENQWNTDQYYHPCKTLPWI